MRQTAAGSVGAAPNGGQARCAAERGGRSLFGVVGRRHGEQSDGRADPETPGQSRSVRGCIPGEAGRTREAAKDSNAPGRWSRGVRPQALASLARS